MSDEDRIAYLAGDDGAVAPDDPQELDDLRELLAHPDMWAEPPADLEDRVAAAIARERVVAGDDAARRVRVSPPPSRRWRSTVVLAVAAALVIAVGIAASISGGHGHGEHLAVALSSPTGATSVEGNAELTRTVSGWRIEIDASGLSRLDNGRFYQAWFRNDAGSLVPIGTFNEGHHVVLWSGVSPHDYPTITVTEEEADGNQASSGKRVLTGSLAPGS